MTNMEITRRTFVATTAAAAGGLMLAVGSARAAAINATPWMSPTDKDGVEVNIWISIDPEGAVTLRQARQEMGQSTFTSLPMIIAEELHADWNMVRVQYVDVHRNLANDDEYGRMSTFGSGSTRGSRTYLQQAGASARERLKAAAAAAWGVDRSQVVAKDSVLTAGNNSGTFAEFATAAAAIDLPEEPAIKTPDQYSLIGTSVARLDTPVKVNGSANYGMDVRLPGMAYAAVKCCPVAWGGLDEFDADAVIDRPGILQVVELENTSQGRGALMNGVAVVADSWYRAKTALDLIPIRWEFGAAVHVNNAGLFARGKVMLNRGGEVRQDDGDALGVIASSSRVVTSEPFVRPYEAHSTMEPMNSTVSIADNRVDIFTGSQNPPSAVSAVADQIGVDAANVYFHNYFLGGGFGRRGLDDATRQAAEIASQAGVPVKVVWTREEDTMLGWHRPMGVASMQAALGDDGLPVAYFARTYGADNGMRNGPYEIENIHVERHGIEAHIPTFPHRAPGNGVTGFMTEQFADMMALEGGWDPLEWRLEMTKSKPDYQLVLNVIKEHAGWSTDLPRGEGMGLSIVESHGSIGAMATTVSVSRRGQLRVEKVEVAVDPGHVVHPLAVTMQMESCIAFELSHTVYGGLEYKDGAVVNSNFDKYNFARIANMPEVVMHFALSGGDKWGGMGEPGVPPLSGSLANAIYFATGKRVFSSPILSHDLSWS